jgi:putative endonuclease
MLCAMKDSMRHHLVLGRRGEDLAAAYLCDQGLVILDRNWRCAMGEIDIVARDGEVVVMCEV